MFRPMRRPQKAVDEKSIEKLLTESRRGVLAVNGDDSYPYAVPVNYFYDPEQKKIYFHGSKVGHKVDAVKACDKVCFTVFGGETVRETAWAPYLRSVVIFGRCHLLETNAESLSILRKLARKYYPDEQTIDGEIAKAGRAVQIFEITIEQMTGKEIQER